MLRSETRTEEFDLRLTPSAKRPLRVAATLPESQRFTLDVQQWAEFRAALDAPFKPAPA